MNKSEKILFSQNLYFGLEEWFKKVIIMSDGNDLINLIPTVPLLRGSEK